MHFAAGNCVYSSAASCPSLVAVSSTNSLLTFQVYVSVSKGERAKLQGIRQELRRAFNGRDVLVMRTVPQFTPVVP